MKLKKARATSEFEYYGMKIKHMNKYEAVYKLTSSTPVLRKGRN